MKTTFIITVIICSAAIVYGVYTTHLSYSKQPQVDVLGSDYNIQMLADHNQNRCVVLYPVHYEIQVVYGPKDLPFAGEWDPYSQLVTLNLESGMDVDTVAHESSHIVDTIMDTWLFEDQHYEAYLVGRITGCIWMLVEEDKK